MNNENSIPVLISALLLILISIPLQQSHSDTEEITVIAIGDITIGSNLTPTIEKHGAGVFFEGTASVIRSADVATASLNTSISERGEPDPRSKLHFRAVPELARALANAGFDAVSLATPHILDFGVEALEDTLTHLEWYNVKPMGAGITPAAANAPVWLDVKSKKVALLSYLRGNEFNMASLNVVASAAFSQMTSAVKEINDTAEIVIVWLHWGKQESDENAQQSSIGRQRIFAQALIDAGADLVLCQQLHTLGGIELYEGKPIIYSLADFIYETYSLQYARTIIPKVSYAEGVLKSIELIPILADKPGVSFPQPSLLKTKDTTKESLDVNLEETAIETLREYQKRCAALKTEVIIKGERGWINSINNSQ